LDNITSTNAQESVDFEETSLQDVKKILLENKKLNKKTFSKNLKKSLF